MSETKKQTNVPEKKLPVKPLTRNEIHEAADKRVSLITKEFADAFEFLEEYPRSVTFFGSSMLAPTDSYYKKAESLAKNIVKSLGYSVVTGGGPGIMEAANRGAFEAGGSSIGITIELPHEQVKNTYLTDYIPLYYFFSRKVCLSFSAEAFIFFPGGFGTLDELMELLTLVQTKKIVSIPIILVGSDYWNKFKEFLANETLSRGMIDKDDLSLFTITDDEEEIIEIIRKTPVREGVKISENHPIS
jgi:uncharacterized protein (TIGR00730 family)